VVNKQGKADMSPEHLEAVIDYIRKGDDRNENAVVFSGGEPLLVPELIKEIVERTSDKGLKYRLFTNGMLLDRVPLDILQPLDTIFVSMDGDKESHEKHRGKGTYDRILESLRAVKPHLKGFVMGRITVEEETNIYRSVTNLLDYVDGVYWQLVSKPAFNDMERFKANYKRDLRQLFDFWMEHLKRGRVLNLVPFQTVVSAMLYDYDNNGVSFRCGAGWMIQVIDLDGNVYWCDEYVGDEKGMFGNIYDGKPLKPPYRKHTEIFEDCRNCEISSICLGRCRKCLEEYSLEQKRMYCDLTRFLVSMIQARIDEIRDIVAKKYRTVRDFYNVPYCTEEIP